MTQRTNEEVNRILSGEYKIKKSEPKNPSPTTNQNDYSKVLDFIMKTGSMWDMLMDFIYKRENGEYKPLETITYKRKAVSKVVKIITDKQKGSHAIAEFLEERKR